SAVLGSAGASVFANDDTTNYHIALANKQAGFDLVPPGTPGLPDYDIAAQFNSMIGTPGCLSTRGWYYGLDANQPSNTINPVAVSVGLTTFTPTTAVHQAGVAAVGAELNNAANAVTADIVVALDAADAAGPTTFDGCSAITNNIAGKIAMINRGTCGFTVKVK